MDSAMGSPITQMALPAAAGYAGSRGGAGGVNSALNTSQYLMRQAADKRVRDFFGEQGPYSEPGQDVTMAGAGTTPPEASRVGDYMDQLNALGAQGGMAAMPTVVRGLTSMNNTLTRYEQPVQVGAGKSLVTPGGEELYRSSKFDVEGGNVINEATGEASAAPLQAGQLAETTRVNDTRISELVAREKLAGGRTATEESKQQLSEARISKILAEIEAGFQKGGGVKAASSQLTDLYAVLNDPEITPEEEIKVRKWISRIQDRMAAITEATKGDDTEEGSASNTAEGTTVASHKVGLQTSPTGQVYDYVPGQGLRPR